MVVRKVAAITAFCKDYGTPLQADAFQLPLSLPSHFSVIPVAQTLETMRNNFKHLFWNTTSYLGSFERWWLNSFGVRPLLKLNI